MPPGRIPAQLGVESLGLRSVVGRFDGGRLTTDRGGKPRESTAGSGCAGAAGIVAGAAQ